MTDDVAVLMPSSDGLTRHRRHDCGVTRPACNPTASGQLGYESSSTGDCDHAACFGGALDDG